MTAALPEPLRRAVLVSGNAGKAMEARRIVGVDLQSVSLDLPEIQSLDLEEVLRAKTEEAWRLLQRPVIVDETGLELDALGGFPGPLVKWMLQAVGAEGISRTALTLQDPGVTARCALMYFDGAVAALGQGSVRGSVVRPRGEAGFGWDSIFQPAGEALTYAELPAQRKDLIGHRGLAWRDLVRELETLSSDPDD